MGSSYVYWAERRAAAKPSGRSLGLSRHNMNITWCGNRGMRWSQLLSSVKQNLISMAPPDILLLHLGANDIGTVKLRDLMKAMNADLSKLQKLLPNTRFGFSFMLPRLKWKGCVNVARLELARKRANRSVSRFILDNGGFVVHHPDITHESPLLYRSDGVHLSDIGCDFLLNMIEGALYDLCRRDS